jgi:hypothetical protein
MSENDSAPAAPSGRKSIVSRLASVLSSHAHLTLAIVVVLVVIIIGMFIYYHGLLFLGPYAKAGFKSGSAARRKKAEGDEDEESAKADPETEKLIATINGR